MFEMEGKPEVSEVHFAEFWENAVSRIKAADERIKPKSAAPSSPSKTPSGRSTSIGNLAAAGVASLSVTSVVDELMTTSLLPVLPSVSTQAGNKETKSHQDVLQHLEDRRVPAMIVFDLAVSSCKSWQSCRNLLDVAEGRLDVQPGPPQPVSRQRSVTGASTGSTTKGEAAPALLGVVPFIHQMHSIVTLSTSESNIRLDVLKEHYQYSIRDALLNASNPLDTTNLCLQISNTLELNKATANLTRALKTQHAGFLLPAETTTRHSSPDVPSSGGSPVSSPTKSRQSSLVHQTTRHILQVMDKISPSWYTVYALPQEKGSGNSSSKRKEQDTANYLLSLYNHVNVLASLLLEAKDWHPGKVCLTPSLTAFLIC